MNVYHQFAISIIMMCQTHIYDTCNRYLQFYQRVCTLSTYDDEWHRIMPSDMCKTNEICRKCQLKRPITRLVRLKRISVFHRQPECDSVGCGFPKNATDTESHTHLLTWRSRNDSSMTRQIFNFHNIRRRRMGCDSVRCVMCAVRSTVLAFFATKNTHYSI